MDRKGRKGGAAACRCGGGLGAGDTGQAQRVGFARALVERPKLIICDEPVSALDVSIQAQLINLLMDLQEKMGLALVFISHNLAVRHISHDIMVMCLGRVVEHAPRSAFYARPLHPYSHALMQAVPEPDPRREKGRIGTALPGELPSVLNPSPGCVFASRCPRVADLCRTTRPELHHLLRRSRGIAQAGGSRRLPLDRSGRDGNAGLALPTNRHNQGPDRICPRRPDLAFGGLGQPQDPVLGRLRICCP